MSEHIWQTFDDLFKTVYRQGRRVEELEARIAVLEGHRQERDTNLASAQSPRPLEQISEMPIERAA
ncbi:MAG: hypothetical protein M3R15_18065 [Acidobacteriota bacterium]|nr:hypothetical protein [Acidobacteriota bacterium]